MNEGLHPVHLTIPPTPITRRPQKEGRGKRAPFTLTDEPPGESEEGTASTGSGAAARRPQIYDGLEVGHRLDDEEGQTIDVTV